MKNWSFPYSTRICKSFRTFVFLTLPACVKETRRKSNRNSTEKNPSIKQKQMRLWNYEEIEIYTESKTTPKRSILTQPTTVLHLTGLANGFYVKIFFFPSYFALSFVSTVCHIIMKIKGIFFRSFDYQLKVNEHKKICVSSFFR